MTRITLQTINAATAVHTTVHNDRDFLLLPPINECTLCYALRELGVVVDWALLTPVKAYQTPKVAMVL